MIQTFKAIFFLSCIAIANLFGAPSSNQTQDLSPIIVDGDLPFDISITTADFSLPNGIHSGASAIHDGKWLFIAGRTNGLHGFNNNTNNFPPSQQNTVVYVVNPHKKTVEFRSLADPSSGLSQAQIDLLSVTSPQSYQSGRTLYMTGGYGVDTATGLFSTKDVLTAIDVPGLMRWVSKKSKGDTAVQHIRQISNPIFQVTGGYMDQIGNHPTLLVFGQNFRGFYFDSSNGDYTMQVRRFRIIDDGKNLDVEVKSSSTPDPNFRRRDLNVVPVIRPDGCKLRQELIAFSGVFTLAGGIWTIPVEITAKGVPTMASPGPGAFMQGMNNYVCPTLGLFSKRTKEMYTVIMGGISFEFYSGGTFQSDPEIPFINQITTVKLDKDGQYTQFLMNSSYPYLFSTQSNPGNQLLFGAGAFFMPVDVPAYRNGVLKLDKIEKPTLVGYIVGGIQSTLPNTNTDSDSSASPYIFKVRLIPK